jgi:cytochrome c2
MKKIGALSAFIILTAASCTPKVNVVNEPLKSTAAEIAQGKTIFENACKRCHDLPEPTKYTSVQWVGIMNSMAPKARLNEEQHRWVYDYVVSVK